MKLRIFCYLLLVILALTASVNEAFSTENPKSIVSVKDNMFLSIYDSLSRQGNKQEMIAYCQSLERDELIELSISGFYLLLNNYTNYWEQRLEQLAYSDMNWSKFRFSLMNQLREKSDLVNILKYMGDFPIVIIATYEKEIDHYLFEYNNSESEFFNGLRLNLDRVLMMPSDLELENELLLCGTNIDMYNPKMEKGKKYLMFLSYHDGVFVRRNSCSYPVQNGKVTDVNNYMKYGVTFDLTKLENDLLVLQGYKKIPE
jgi:hypothetical protein